MKIPDLFAGLPDLRQQSKITYTLTSLSLWALAAFSDKALKMPFKRHLRVSTMELKSLIVCAGKALPSQAKGGLHPLQKDFRKTDPIGATTDATHPQSPEI